MTDALFWDEIFSGLDASKVRYDLWLEPFAEELEKSAGIPMIDLGCGAGNDTLYLSERGYEVIACDHSTAALQKVSELVPKARTQIIRMPDPLPFPDRSAQVVIADLSLHYFAWADTLKIAADIRRILRPGGVLICRLNSVKDVEYGAGQGLELEPNYYELDGKRKRFFDRDQLERLFKGWKASVMEEQSMNRYDKPKAVWVAAAHS